MLNPALLTRTYKHYERYQSSEYIVTPSLPILYFGNLEEYINSKIRIITVAKNPSRNEFRLKDDDPYSFCRFPDWDPIRKNIFQVLNAYFTEHPLSSWFSSLEPILNPMNASFYSNNTYNNRVLHTDICTPLATDPTWGGLSQTQRDELSLEGYSIWTSLIEELQPNVMLVSIPNQLFAKYFPIECHSILKIAKKKNGEDRKRPYEVKIGNYSLSSGKMVTLVYGFAAQKPFGTVTNAQRRKIGKTIREQIILTP